MTNLESQLEPGSAIVNGKSVTAMRGVRLDYRSLEIYLLGRKCIDLYTFNSLMLASQPKQIRVDEYVFKGPKLGLYHDTADMRNGPYVNHFIDHLEISIKCCPGGEFTFSIKGKADLSKSSFDPNCYKGGTSGDWTFEVTFVHRVQKA